MDPLSAAMAFRSLALRVLLLSRCLRRWRRFHGHNTRRHHRRMGAYGREKIAFQGAGAVKRSIGRSELKNLDHFLSLDEFSVSPPAGFPDHPHRGFETVTYMIKWMTAGRGIVHCEMPTSKGIQKGLQLWVNLSSKDKMIEPAYQELEDKCIPKVEKDGVRETVIAGEALGELSPLYTHELQQCSWISQ